MNSVWPYVLAFSTLGVVAGRAPAQISGTVPPDEVLARVGPKVVTAEEFLERIELMPWQEKELVTMHDTVKARALRSLVAEKLLALEARETGVGGDERTQDMLRELRRMLTRDQLYTDEVVKKTTVTEEERRTGFGRYPWTLLVRGYSFPDRESAGRFAARCRSAANFDSAASALAFMALGVTDTLHISYGDLFPTYEDAIYALHRPGVTDPAFSPSEGWAVYLVYDRQKNAAWAGASPNDTRIQVEKKARTRLERIRAMAFATSYLRHRTMRIDSALFVDLADNVIQIVRHDSSAMAHRLSNYIDDLRARFAARLREPFAEGNGVTWTLADILESLRYYPGEFPSRHNPRIIAFALNRFVMEAVEGEMFSAEGEKRGLDRRPDVERHMEIWQDAWRGWEMGKEIRDRIPGAASLDPARHDSTSIALAAKVTNALNKHIAALAQKYGVEIFENNLRTVPISRFSMVTRHYIGFGGVLLAIPMIVPDWNWISRLSTPSLAP
jgi:predicted metal-dependent HD superfamily phosphohydrolase